ncbi:hypothetical protein M595_1420 [Lyngbya aestuarii BL J]|uniref:Uncharacterized protein n=1 Tax=Lyngbya aestuarii BL J TaxID=1348334 RepID=U7QL45_9CYAN|nr:hypothetical protein [Lyngbya aestuarii]ERT08598.1 hypothetical protein M595_1420 [Lyngbya aestuarii BL J]
MYYKFQDFSLLRLTASCRPVSQHNQRVGDRYPPPTSSQTAIASMGLE